MLQLLDYVVYIFVIAESGLVQLPYFFFDSHARHEVGHSVGHGGIGILI